MCNNDMAERVVGAGGRVSLALDFDWMVLTEWGVGASHADILTLYTDPRLGAVASNTSQKLFTGKIYFRS